MKLNWGKGITVFIGIFLITILSLIIRTSHEKIVLVTENYYEQELQYQDEIEALKNAAKMVDKVIINQDDSCLKVLFPEYLNNDSISGNIYLYKASDKTKDYDTRIILDSVNRQFIRKEILDKGKYTIHISWTFFNKTYKIKKELLIF